MNHDAHDADVQDAWAAQDDADQYLNPTIMGDYMIRTTATVFPDPPGYKASVSRRGHDGSETGPGSFVISVTSIYHTRQEALVRALSWLPDGEAQPTRAAGTIAPDAEVSDYVAQYRLLRQAVTLLNPGVHELLSAVLSLEVTAPEWSAFTVTEVRRLRADCAAMATKLLHLAEEKAKQEEADALDAMPF